MSTLGAIWANRSTRLCVPKSGEQLDQIAPMLAQATMAMTASGMFGITAATRSPSPDAEPSQAGRRRRDRGREVSAADLAERLAFRCEQERGSIGREPPDERLGVVELGALEPVARRASSRRRGPGSGRRVSGMS